MSDITKVTEITTTEMHSGGEPLRIIESGYPEILGETILDKRRYCRENLDHLRKFLMFEPRGHYDMYGALLVKPDIAEADLAVLFLHNEGYSTMCGHAVMALGRYAVDKGLVPKAEGSSETRVRIQCPCGLVTAFVGLGGSGKAIRTRFYSVPAFAFALDVEVDVAGYGLVKVDIGYGGTFYALASADRFDLDVRKSATKDLMTVATAVSEAVRKSVKLRHPEFPDVEFLYGTILTDGNDAYSETPTANVCVFANKEVDRAPTGSGVTARLAVQYSRGLIGLNRSRGFESGATGSLYEGQVVKQTKCGEQDAVIVEVSGTGYYTGRSTFTAEDEDELKKGFLLK